MKPSDDVAAAPGSPERSVPGKGNGRRLPWLLALILIPLAGSVLTSGSDCCCATGAHTNIALHAVLEAQGGIACLALALIMMFLLSSKEDARRDTSLIIVTSLVFSGTLDGFHAACEPGNAFVWLRSLSTFGGGLILATVWWPGNSHVRTLAPWAVLGIAITEGGAALLVPDHLPMMLRDGTFTPVSDFMNIAGGIGYLAGAAALAVREKKHGRFSTLLIATLSLFGMAGLLFGVSEPWDHNWWWWHIVRYAASLLLLAQTMHLARGLQRKILSDRDSLERAVTARTEELTATNADMEQALRDLKLNRYMLDKATIAIYLIDENNRFAYLNECAAKYAGYTVAELTGQSIGLLNPSVKKEGWADRWEKLNALPPGELDVVTMIHHRKDGTTYPIELFAHHLSHGGKTYRLSMGIDITGRVREEKSKARFAALAEQALDLTHSGHWHASVDNSGEYFSSARIAEIFGDPPNPEYRYPIPHWYSCIEAVDAEIARATAENYAKACRGEIPKYDALYPYKRPVDGRIVWVRAIGVLVNDPDHHCPEMYGVIQDVTDTVIAKRELEEARRVAEKANRLKSEFLANMSHEIRTPMNAILGYAQLMRRDTSLSAAHLGQLETINRAGEHLLALINDILEMSKIEAGRITLNADTFDLHALVDELVELYAARARGKGLALRLERAPGVPRFVSTDGGKLRQALLNLIGNAVKFTTEGGVTIVVDALKKPDGTVVLSFAVADTGPGIDAGEIKNLFRAFVQSSAGVKAGGTGLGLALSKNYAQLMGGDITVESEPGKGATFTLTVLARPSVAVAATTHTVNPMPLRLTGGQQEIRILIADDVPVNRELLADILNPMGFATRIAENGAEAVEIFKKWRPDIILMDMRMPVMDGYEANRQIKATPEGADTFILALTASAFEEEKSEVLASGADDFMRKPFRIEDLLAKFGEKLGLRYDYSDTPETAGAVGYGTVIPTEIDFPKLETGTAEAFRKACDEADYDKLLKLCEALEKTAPNAASALRQRIHAFDYESVLKLIS